LTYPLIGDIPDLRVNLPAWIDVDTDWQNAHRLLGLSPGLTTGELVAEVFRQRGWSSNEVNDRTTQTLQGPARLGRELDDWLAIPTTASRGFLEVGCGGGSLLAAAAARGRHGIGVDVSLEWLVVAQRFITEHGGTPRLAAAMAEALPVADASTESVVSLDVVEHVVMRAFGTLDPHVLLAEIPGEELARFAPVKALAARAYNRALRFRLGRVLLLFVCPLFRILACKKPA